MIDRDWSRVPVVGVGRLANYVKRKLEGDAKLAMLGVEGEITNLRVQSTGSWNFDVKDRDAVLACFSYPSDAATFPAAKNGDAIVVYGRVSTFEKSSKYQLIVRHAELAGIGALYARYEELRRKLEAEGLFREDRKLPIPAYPFRVALVGSPTGDGTRDFRAQAATRAPHVAVQLFDTPVQGDVAPQILAALQRAYAWRPDLVVLARGGGSFEDLFVFNDARLVRAVANAPVPVVTAIGHESNTSLVDYASSRRAATPSTAAQTLLPQRDELIRSLALDRERLGRSLDTKLHRFRNQLERIEHRSPLADPALFLASRYQRLEVAASALTRSAHTRLARTRERVAVLERLLERRSPASTLATWRARFDGLRPRLNARFLAEKRSARQVLEQRLDRSLARALEAWRYRLDLATAQLGGVDPRAPLTRGFAIVRRSEGRLLTDSGDAPPGTRLTIELARGELAARVEDRDPDGGEQIGLF